jgi:Ca2+-binding RTX toxin-like protein
VATNIGTSGNDKIIGKNFAEMLFGKAGNDRLIGKSGDDIITGGKGNDVMSGGGGADRFVFGRKATGKDVITDFDVTKDILQIPKGLNSINSAKDVLKHAVQKGSDVIIDLGHDNTIKLKNVDLDDLKSHPGDHFDIV